MGDRQPLSDMPGASRGGRAAEARRRSPVRRKHRAQRVDFGLKLRGRWLVLFAALFAFCWQSVAAATHHHPQTESASRIDAGKPGSVAQPRTQGDSQDSPANCPICRELAHTANYLSPAPIIFTAPLSATPQRIAVAPLSLSVGQRWHGWRSRAPPALS